MLCGRFLGRRASGLLGYSSHAASAAHAPSCVTRRLLSSRTTSNKTYDFVTTETGPRIVLGPATSRYGKSAELVSAGMLLRMKRRVAPEKALTVAGGSSVLFAVERMVLNNVGAVMVVDEESGKAEESSDSAKKRNHSPHVVGILTERDYLKKVVLKGLKSSETSAKDVCTKEVVSVRAEDTFDTAVRLLAARDFRHLAVQHASSPTDPPRSLQTLDDLAGILSVKDLTWMLYALMFEGSGGRYNASPCPEASSWSKLTVADVMDLAGHEAGAVHSIEPSESVLDAVTQMSNLNVGALLVCDQCQHSVLAIVTERDYLTGIVLKGRTSSVTPVHEIMTTHPVCVTPSHTIEQLLKIFVSTNIRHVPVVGKPTASSNSGVTQVVSMRDVLCAVVRHIDASG